MDADWCQGSHPVKDTKGGRKKTVAVEVSDPKATTKKGGVEPFLGMSN